MKELVCGGIESERRGKWKRMEGRRERESKRKWKVPYLVIDENTGAKRVADGINDKHDSCQHREGPMCGADAGRGRRPTLCLRPSLEPEPCAARALHTVNRLQRRHRDVSVASVEVEK
jgi:hypothetical protein